MGNTRVEPGISRDIHVSRTGYRNFAWETELFTVLPGEFTVSPPSCRGYYPGWGAFPPCIRGVARIFLGGVKSSSAPTS